MTLHIFNPEHDMSLAQNSPNYTPSRAALQIRNDLAFLPYIWAKQGDAVLVNDVTEARASVEKLRLKKKEVCFVNASTLESISDKIEIVSPWGWNCTLKEQLRRVGIPQRLLPSDEQLAKIADLSNRKFAVGLLSALKALLPANAIVGKSYYFDNLDDLRTKAKDIGKAVIKAPWSGSGRGLRFTDEEISTVHLNWAKNVIAQQQGIILEPYYNKVKDFALEFYVEEDSVKYCGLSVFLSLHGAYTGSIIANEDKKRNLLGQFVNIKVLDTVKESLTDLLEQHIKGKYKGPLGVDMMIVESKRSSDFTTSSYSIHPLVEVNLRRTMGHVALSLYDEIKAQNKVMQITFDGSHHRLEINDSV
ncbi:hypothetical protein CBG55_01580 [Prevotella intermedia]|uniref:ATP-grasp domain-containing protein n=1 Tax=Prevotella intermedia TaxID=28131 RepID=A0A2M8TLR3_PREIN|nr:hypothetical protein [Prevotella intermedia]OWP32937.1 hypothetical protein CBG55_01580 [Prevotella intermedia]PJI24849.1 hypothetical protein CTM59_01580 [Prevotella intermedia]